MMGLTRWWSRLPVAGRVVVGLGLAGLVFLGVGLGVDWVAGLIVLGIIAVALGLFLLIRLVVVRREKRKGQGLAGKLWAGMSGGAGSGLDESTEELSIRQEMEGRWKKVYETLRERNYDYYSFPWYLIIGAAQSGKTTTIQKSNQEFPIGDEPVADYGGTKGCNWFFTNQAIIIDTAGRYVEHLGEDDAEWDSMLARDQEEWNTFLKLLKEGRARSPINGVIITIKLADVLEQDPRRRKKVTDAMRKALLDIEEKFEVRVPVYVLITMCDLLVGFVDYFANLPGLSDRTLFGWSREAAFDKDFDAAEFGPAFSDLSAKVDAMVLDFLEVQAGRGGDLPADVTRMDRMLAFPDEFRSLADPLQTLLAEIFKKSSYNEQHFVRGVYFTSGVQEGRPVMNACLSLVGDGASGMQEDDVALSSDGSKAYFIADLYEEKVFKEAGLVRMTRRARAQQRLKKYAYSGVAAALAIAAGLWVATEIASINSLDLFSPDDLRALTLREVTPAQLRSEGELLRGDTGLQGLASAVSDMAGEEYREASLLGREDVENARRSLHEAYRRLFAEKAFGPLLDGVVDEWRQRELASWSECVRLTDVLLAVRGLARDEGDLASLVDVIIPGLGELASAEDTLNYGQLAELAAALAGEDGVGSVRHVRSVAAGQLAAVDELLNERVLGHWNGWLTALDRPLADAGGRAARRPDLDELRPFWTWRRMQSLDGTLADELDGLTDVLKQVESSKKELDAFQRSVSTPWSERFTDVSRLRVALDTHLEQLDLPVTVGPKAAHEQLMQRFEPLADLELDDRAGSDEEVLARAREQLELRLEGLQRPLAIWAQPEKAEVVAVIGGEGALAAVSSATGISEVGPWRPASQLTRSIWERLEAIDELVGYVAADDPAADPSTREFWVLADRFEAWFEKDAAAEGEADRSGFPRAVRDLVEKVSDDALLQALRTHKLDAFAAHLNAQLANVDARAAFLDGIDASVVPDVFTQQGFGPVLREQPANAYIVAALGRVATSLSGQLEARAAELSPASSGLDDAIRATLERFVVAVADPYWSNERDPLNRGPRLLEVAREAGLVPAPPELGWKPLIEWLRRELADGERSLDGFHTLARYAGDQAATEVSKMLLALSAADVAEALEPSLALWQRYSGQGPAVASVQDVSRQLSRALEQLVALDDKVDMYDRLAPVQPGTSIYEGLMAPQRLREQWAEAGLRDPIVDGLCEIAQSARDSLGQLASTLFAQRWAELGAPDGPAAGLHDKFPFRRIPLVDEVSPASLADWEATSEFFGDARFRQLVDVVYPHVQSGSSEGFALYQVDFGSPTLGTEFRRCVQLASLCGLVGEGRSSGVRVELYDGYQFENDMPNGWVFGLGQSSVADDDVKLDLPLGPKGITGDQAPKWSPSNPTRITWDELDPNDAEPGEWVYDGSRTKRDHWASVLLFVYGNERLPRAPDRVRNPADLPPDVRWISVPFKLTRGRAAGAWRIFGVRLQGMPDELPDLTKAFDIG